MSSRITLRNQHSIRAVLEARPKDILEYRAKASKLDSDRETMELVDALKRTGAPLSDFRKNKSDSRADSPRSSSFEVDVRAKPEATLDELFGESDESSRDIFLVLDCVQDPQNVGSIFRSAAFFGVKGIILGSDRTASMTSTVYDVASGGVECVPYFVAGNISRTLEKIKEDYPVWVLGTSEHESQSLEDVAKDRNWIIVLGNEETGIRRQTLDDCDVLCGIMGSSREHGPQVTSLNVSSAAAILIKTLSV